MKDVSVVNLAFMQRQYKYPTDPHIDVLIVVFQPTQLNKDGLVINFHVYFKVVVNESIKTLIYDSKRIFMIFWCMIYEFKRH